MAKKYHGTNPFPAGKDHYGMPMGSHIVDMNQPQTAPTKVQSDASTIDKHIAEDVAKLKNQMHRD